MKISDTYGSWVILEVLPKGRARVLCTSCQETIKIVRTADLTLGRSRMCKACSVGTSKHSHGMSETSEYHTWVQMIQRCHNPKSKDYPNYGAKGIEVDPSWRDSFESFYMCVGPKPTPDHTIERLDFRKGYTPGNVTWATRQEQNVNRSCNVEITIDGETKVVSEWSRDPRCTVSLFSIYKRLNRGWTPEDAVLKPSKGVK